MTSPVSGRYLLVPASHNVSGQWAVQESLGAGRGLVLGGCGPGLCPAQPRSSSQEQGRRHFAAISSIMDTETQDIVVKCRRHGRCHTDASKFEGHIIL